MVHLKNYCRTLSSLIYETVSFERRAHYINAKLLANFPSLKFQVVLLMSESSFHQCQTIAELSKKRCISTEKVQFISATLPLISFSNLKSYLLRVRFSASKTVQWFINAKLLPSILNSKQYYLRMWDNLHQCQNSWQTSLVCFQLDYLCRAWKANTLISYRAILWYNSHIFKK